MTATSKWFDRKFEFKLDNKDFNLLLKRLEQCPVKVLEHIKNLSAVILEHKPNDKWSIKEQIGHLYILELLWQTRISELKQGKPELSPADLSNNATTEGKFNDWEIAELTEKFGEARKKTLEMLERLTDQEKINTSFHPRLKQPMRMIDHLFFIAEHDDHHLEKIKELAVQAS